MVERLTNLISIFQKPELDFSKNRAEHDDILGDAYEYLMRHFATESGKSKGQFYTPSEVNISKSKLLALPLDFPPPAEQAAIAAFLSDMDAELTGLEARRDKTRALKQGMMQELLTGRTRLV